MSRRHAAHAQLRERAARLRSLVLLNFSAAASASRARSSWTASTAARLPASTAITVATSPAARPRYMTLGGACSRTLRRRRAAGGRRDRRHVQYERAVGQRGGDERVLARLGLAPAGMALANASTARAFIARGRGALVWGAALVMLPRSRAPGASAAAHDRWDRARGACGHAPPRVRAPSTGERSRHRGDARRVIGVPFLRPYMVRRGRTSASCVNLPRMGNLHGGSPT